MIANEEVRTTTFYHSLENKQQESLLILNSIGKIIYASRPAADFFDVDLANIIGKMFVSVFPLHEQHRLRDEIFHLKPNLVSRYKTTIGNRTDSHTHTFIMHPVASHGRILMIIVTIEDICLYDQLRFELDRSLRQERKYKEAISHHFFNPLAIAKGYLHLASDKCDKDMKNKFSAIDNALNRIEKTVKTVIKTGKL